MTNNKDKILNYIISEYEFFKKETLEIRRRRDKMTKESFTYDWQEIEDAYKTELFMKVYDLMLDKIDMSFEDLYCELESMDLISIFELDN